MHLNKLIEPKIALHLEVCSVTPQNLAIYGHSLLYYKTYKTILDLAAFIHCEEQPWPCDQNLILLYMALMLNFA